MKYISTTYFLLFIVFSLIIIGFLQIIYSFLYTEAGIREVFLLKIVIIGCVIFVMLSVFKIFNLKNSSRKFLLTVCLILSLFIGGISYLILMVNYAS